MGGRGSTLIAYEQQVYLWRHVANLGPSRRASALLLRMDTVARQVFLHAGGDTFTNGKGAGSVLGILREYFAPGAVDSISQGGVRFFAVQATRPNDGCLSGGVRNAPTRGSAHNTDGRGPSRGVCVCVLCTQEVLLSRPERSLMSRSVQGKLAPRAKAKRMRRLLDRVAARLVKMFGLLLIWMRPLGKDRF